jgi:hypothetical protein
MREKKSSDPFLENDSYGVFEIQCCGLTFIYACLVDWEEARWSNTQRVRILLVFAVEAVIRDFFNIYVLEVIYFVFLIVLMYYFYVLLNEKYFKKQLLSYSQALF